jgi:hypothetical protein
MGSTSTCRLSNIIALERMSAGGLTDMMEGPAAFWSRSWLNPHREEKEDSKAMLHGRAYHCARLEPEEFDQAVRAGHLVPEDMPEGSLLSDRDYKAWLKEMGHPQTKGSETVLERA